ncbi:MAG: class A beta-lactamase-related serine hydrolase [Myxococcales bacterium]|nr:MAG: class A beta-lactamase-related serine hydrolase [Myxococcales bacterium]
MAGTICACSPPRPVGALPPGRSASPAAAAAAPFVPTPAPAARKARLLAVAGALDDVYRARLSESGATAAAVGIVLEGELVYVGTFGVSDVSSGAAVDERTVFRIGSLTKSFAATTILQLRDRGLLQLDAPAVRYLPELARLQSPSSDAGPITLRHLLTMTSGLPYDDTWGTVSFGYDDAELTRFLEGRPRLSSVPGERYAYSNLGYALLGRVVERLTGQHFLDYLRTELLLPLGMTATGAKRPARGLAVGYYRDAAQNDALYAEPHPDDGVFAPAGGLYTSLRDYARYLAFQLAAYPARDAPEEGPLRRSSLREMHRGQSWLRWNADVPVAKKLAGGALSLSAARYGYGWVQQTTCAFDGIVQHGGYEPGYFSYVRLLPQHGLGVVVFSTTAAVGDSKTFERAMGVLRQGGVLELPSDNVSPQLAQRIAEVNELLARFDAARFRESFDPDSLRYSWLASIPEAFSRLKRDHGRCEPSGSPQRLGATEARWLLACERGWLSLSLVLAPTAASQIASVHWTEHGASEPIQPASEPFAPCGDEGG